MSISVYDETSGLLSFPYVIERGERLDQPPDPPDRLPQARDRDARAAAARGDHSRGLGALRQPLRPRRRAGQVGALRPARRRRARDRRDLAPERRSHACVRRGRPTAPVHPGGQPERRARQRSAAARDAPARGRARNREQRRPGAGVAARPRRADRARRRAGARDVRGRPRVRRAARPAVRSDRLRLLLRERAAPGRAVDRLRRGADLPDPRVACTAAAQPVTAVRVSRSTRPRGWAPRCGPTWACRSSSATRRSE